MSDGEGELDGPTNEVTLPQKMSGRGNVELAKSAIKLVAVHFKPVQSLMACQTEDLAALEIL